MFKNENQRYCFVATRSEDLKNRLDLLDMHLVAKGVAGARYTYFFSNANVPDPAFTTVINDQEDYSVEETIQAVRSGRTPEHSYDSIISFGCLGERLFCCAADFWGVNSHYWAENDETFCCSNDVFLVAGLQRSSLSRESLYEYLFFLAPMRARTWFEGVKTLRADQTLVYDLANHTLQLSEPTDLADELIYSPSGVMPLNESIDRFFQGAKASIRDRKAMLCLSAGSDSRTVLSCLRRYGLHPMTYSFGRPDMWETHDIMKVVKKYDIPWELVDLTGFENDWEVLFREASAWSNGLVNPFRVHYHAIYNRIPEETSLFEGICGSEFVKGIEAIGAMVSSHHAWTIKGNHTIGEAIDSRFGFLESDFRSFMKEYLQDEFGDELSDINTEKGLRRYQSFALEFVPSRAFAGLIQLSGRRHSVFFPFMSPGILKSVFARRCGLAGGVDLRDDFVGYVKAIQIEAEIAKYADKEIFESMLDKNISFEEATKKPALAYVVIRKARSLRKKLEYRNLFRGQVDVAQMRERVRAFVAKKGISEQIELSGSSQVDKCLKELANLAVVEDLAKYSLIGNRSDNQAT